MPPTTYVSYAISNLTAGTYHVYIGADAGANRGQFQLACGPNGGALANVGSVQDTYSPTNVAYLLPIHLSTPTNFITLWTNMLQEMDCGTWQAPSNGNYQFKFSVAGKNAASSGYKLAFDYIKLTPGTVSSPAPALAVTGQAGAVVLSWPVSSAGFSLESATDLAAMDWQPAGTPVVIGGYNVLTNDTMGAVRFYRLRK